MKQKLAHLTVIAFCVLLSSCKPKPITGQVFIVTAAGLNFPLGAVQIEVISPKDADDFMQHRQIEIVNKVHSLEGACNNAKTNLVTAAQAEAQAQAAVMAAEKSYINNPEYVALVNEKEKNLQTVDTLTKAILYLERQAYPSGSSVATIFPPPAERQKRADEANAIGQDRERCSTLELRDIEINDECEAIKNKFLYPLWQAHSKAADALAQAKSKSSEAIVALQNFPTVNDYFDGFSPVPIEITVSDAQGNFTIQKLKKGAKVFAKAQRQTLDSVENYFWLVNPPATGEKLILSNNNMFTTGLLLSM